MSIPNDIEIHLQNIRRMSANSHKGQNGKALLIGGSQLFHAASRWSLDTLSSMVDMVFYSSVPENNELIKEAKKEFWDGVVVPRSKLEEYIQEAEVILIGPGMTRQESKIKDVEAWRSKLLSHANQDLVSESSATKELVASLRSQVDFDEDTYAVTNYLLCMYPNKKWVIDAGALQLVEPRLLSKHTIITPHHKELLTLLSHMDYSNRRDPDGDEYGEEFDGETLKTLSIQLGGTTILLKGESDIVCSGNETKIINGGNPGMTKGGTGDALAGLVAGLYAFSEEPFSVAIVASYANKAAGDQLFKRTGPFYKTSELVSQIPIVLKQLLYSE